MRAKYAKYRNMMKKRAMMTAKKKGQSPDGHLADLEGGASLETDDLVDFSEERYDDDRGGVSISLLEQWSDDEEDWDEDWDEEEAEREDPEEETDEEILDFLKRKFMGGGK